MGDMMSQGISSFLSVSLIIPILIVFLLLFSLLFVAPFSFGVYLLGDYKSKKRKKMLQPKVLIVDDDEASILVLQNILESKSALVKVVQSGEDMIDELNEDEFDVIFVDREMPYLNGDAALKISDYKLSLNRKIPVVFFTGVEQSFELPKVSQFSILEIWEKRLSYKKLEEKVGLLLRNLQRGGKVAYSSS